MAVERSKEAGRILADFEKARTQRQTKDKLWMELDEFDRGEQWKNAAKMPPWVPKPVTNYVHFVKTMKKAGLSLNNPTGKLRPVSPDEIERVRKLQKGYEYAWKKSRSRMTVREVIETSRLLGTGISQIFWQETEVRGGKNALYEGEIGSKQIDPSIFYPDPSAYRIDDCRFIHVVEKKPVEWLKNHPMFAEGMKGVQPRNLADQEVGDIYQRDTTAAKDDGMIDFRQHFEKVKSDNGGWNYKVTYLAGEKIIHTIDPLVPNCYPFATLYDFKQRKDFWGLGTCGLILENQKIINKVESIIALIGTQLQNPQTIVHRAAGINPAEVSRYGSAPGKVWESNIPVERAMTWRKPAPIPQQLFALAETAAQNIREISGMTEAYVGQSVGSLQTSSGVNSLIDRSTLRDRDQMVDLEEFIEDYSRILIQFITTKYTETRHIRQEESQQEEVTSDSFVPFRGTDYKGINFDFFLDASSKAPISRQRQKEEANQLLTIQGQYGFDPPVITPQEYIRQSELMNADAIVQRMDRDEMQSDLKILQQVTAMVNEAYQNNLSPQEIAKMSQQMLVQKMQQKQEGVGSANTGQAQLSQQGTPKAAPAQ